jgi:hypothetical protein
MSTPNTALRPSVETWRFQFSHLKQPRGFGHWLFEDRAGKVMWQGSGLYSDCKRLAIRIGQIQKIPTIFVCP